MAILYKEQLGRAIKRRREDLGLTQRQLADLVNVEEAQTVSRWERGLNSPTDLEAVAAGLQTTAAEILRELEPIGHRERRRMMPSEGTQLDRIEAKLDRILAQLPVSDPGADFERETEASGLPSTHSFGGSAANVPAPPPAGRRHRAPRRSPP